MSRTRCLFLLLAVLTCCTIRSVASETFIWIEGEAAVRNEIHSNAWFEAVDPLELSAGAQIANFSELAQTDGWAEYEFTASLSGGYNFWLRANPASGLEYSFDGANPSSLDPASLEAEDRNHRNQADYIHKVQQPANVAADGTHDARIMTWFYLGKVDLSEGKHVLRFSLGGRRPNTKRFAAIDCFLLTMSDFAPNLQFKPSEQPTNLVAFADRQIWAFAPERDAFATNAVFDLRNLNESVAGEHGFIKLSNDRTEFARGDGKRIRFWGGSTYVQRMARESKDQSPLEHHARFLAKRGVNIVRLHGSIVPKSPDSSLTDIDAQELDEIYRLVAAMKKSGIYTVISPYWGVHVRAQKNWGVPDAGNGNCTALLFFDPVLQSGYKAWLKRIYADVNPYTGIPLAKDASVAMIQIQNEDSMLFWTMQTVQGQQLVNLREKFGKWVLKKYGSFEKAREGWGKYPHPDDDFANQRPGMFIVWELTQAARNRKGNERSREARLADQCEFMAEIMYDFNREIARYLREALGCKQLINAGNWRTADQVVLDDVERWSYTANDVIGKNHYFGGIHNGLNEGWQILPGQVFTSRTFAKDPVGSPLNIRQTAGYPFIISESLWVPPTLYSSEGPLVVAGQSSLAGLDTFFWFCTGSEEWEKPINKWTFALPTTLGQFPAAALMFRNGYLKEAPAVVHEERSLKDVWERKLPLIAEEGAWDPNRDKGEMPEGIKLKSVVDPLAYLVGRVEVVYGGNGAKSKVMDLSSYISADRQTVKSATGQISTDLQRGVYSINAPKAQALAGFLDKAGCIELSDISVTCNNEYAALAVVPLDDRPIASSRKLLVQVGTVSRPTGWVEKPMRVPKDGGFVPASRIVQTGKEPWLVEKTDAIVRIRNNQVQTAIALDANMMPRSRVELGREGRSVTVKLPPDCLYVVLTSE